MKRYLTLLTVSFLSTTTLAEAVKLNIHELPADHEERTKSLTAKAEKLEKNINYTENEGLKEVFTTKYRIVRTLIDNPLLSEQDAEAYKAANEQRNMIAANFYHNEYQRGAYEKLENIKGYSESGIYPEDSQEGRDLKEIAESIKKIWAWRATEEDKLKGIAGYLKREKRANQLSENIDEIKREIFVEAESIKAGPLLSELREIEKTLPKDVYSNDVNKINDALHCIQSICESEDEPQIIKYVIRYRKIKEGLLSLEEYRELIKDSPLLVFNVLSGEYLELEEKIATHLYNYNHPVREEMNEVFRIMEQVKMLPLLLKRLNELAPKVEGALARTERLEEAQRLEEERELLSSFAAPSSGFSFGVEGDFPLDPFPSSSSSSSTPAVEPDLKVENPLFSMGEPSPYLSTSGFSVPEGDHIWTNAKIAKVTLPLARMYPRPSSITFFDTTGLITANHTQVLTVKVNGEQAAQYEYAPGNNDHTIEIRLPQADQAEIELEIPNAKSPFDLGMSADKRELGISFKAVLLNLDPVANADHDDH